MIWNALLYVHVMLMDAYYMLNRNVVIQSIFVDDKKASSALVKYIQLCLIFGRDVTARGIVSWVRNVSVDSGTQVKLHWKCKDHFVEYCLIVPQKNFDTKINLQSLSSSEVKTDFIIFECDGDFRCQTGTINQLLGPNSDFMKGLVSVTPSDIGCQNNLTIETLDKTVVLPVNQPFYTILDNRLKTEELKMGKESENVNSSENEKSNNVTQRVIAVCCTATGLSVGSSQLMTLGAACYDYFPGGTCEFVDSKQWSVSGFKMPTRNKDGETIYNDFDKEQWEGFWKQNYQLLGWAVANGNAMNVVGEEFRKTLDVWMSDKSETLDVTVVVRNASFQVSRINNLLLSVLGPFSNIEYQFGNEENSPRTVFKNVEDLDYLVNLNSLGVFKNTCTDDLSPQTHFFPKEICCDIASKYIQLMKTIIWK